MNMVSNLQYSSTACQSYKTSSGSSGETVCGSNSKMANSQQSLFSGGCKAPLEACLDI